MTHSCHLFKRGLRKPHQKGSAPKVLGQTLTEPITVAAGDPVLHWLEVMTVLKVMVPLSTSVEERRLEGPSPPIPRWLGTPEKDELLSEERTGLVGDH